MVDQTGTLGPNEVFIQIKRDQKDRWMENFMACMSDDQSNGSAIDLEETKQQAATCEPDFDQMSIAESEIAISPGETN